MTLAAISCSPDEVRAQMKRILTCRDFDASDRNRRFLEYVIEETLQGRADRIKAYSIATSVFGRGENFDPQQDAIVRIEAGRMRRSLEHYYLTSGLNDPIRIAIPVGSYVPSFTFVQRDPTLSDHPDGPAATRDMSAQALVHRPTIRVAAFAAEGVTDGLATFAGGVTRHLMVALTRFTDLVVIGPDVEDSGSSRSEAADFALSGAVAVTQGQLSVEVLLRDTATGQYVWSDSIERQIPVAGLAGLRAEVADRIAGALGQPSGVIFSYCARALHLATPETIGSFQSVVLFHSYWRTYDRDQFEPVRLALERTILRDPGYAEAYACLSQMYTNSIRFGYGGEVPSLNPLRRAISLAQWAIQLSPSSSRAYLALSIAFWFSGQVDSALQALQTSRDLNPNDMEIGAELGFRLCMRMNWAEGVPLIEEAYRRCPALPGAYRVGLSIWHFVHQRPENALFEARKVNAPGVIYPHVMIAVSATRLGLVQEAQSALASMRTLYPDYGNVIFTDLERRNLHPDLIAVLVRGLQEAGLDCKVVVPRQPLPLRPLHLTAQGGKPAAKPR
jgi:adenylate cyclase